MLAVANRVIVTPWDTSSDGLVPDLVAFIFADLGPKRPAKRTSGRSWWRIEASLGS